MSTNTAWDLNALMVPTKAAAIFAAQENSLFMNGLILPNLVIPAGSFSAQVPVFGAGSAQTITEADHTTGNNAGDLIVVPTTATKVNINLELFGSRDIIRDLGHVDTADLGRVLGQSVASAYDSSVVATMNTATGTAAVTAGEEIEAMFDAAAAIRGAGEMGQLFAVVSTTAAAELLKQIAGAAFAGGDYQTSALVNGFVGKIAGITVFQSSHMTGKGVVFGQDALRTVSQDGMKVEMQRRAEAVGTDVVASYAGGSGLIDQSRAVKLVAA